MFETFGAHQASDANGTPTSKTVEFSVFFPGLGRGPFQCGWGGEPEIEKLEVVGSFCAWSFPEAVELTPDAARGARLGGTLYTARVPGLAPGFYTYKYLVTFKDGTKRLVADPCARYAGGGFEEDCGFVIDDPATYVAPKVAALPRRLPAGDLVIYELMIDDFTAEFRGTGAPVAAITSDRLRRLRDLGFNAVELMPVTAWPGGKFSWGYDPYLFFAAAHRYVDDPANPTVKLDAIKALVSRCHEQGLHVIMDLVLNHANGSRKGLGFPYYWLYRHAENCPFVGPFEGGGFFLDLDYENLCCDAFISDACRYWMKEFKIDGIRLDYTLGYYDPERSDVGLQKLVRDIRDADPDPNFYLSIEHLTDNRYDAIDVCNRVGATSNWFDSSYFVCRDGLLNKRRDDRRDSPVDEALMRVVNSCMDYGDGRWPTLYLSNHDHSDPASFGEGQARWFRLQPWTILLYTLPGALLLYNGQEFADDAYVPEDGDGRVAPRPLRWRDKRDASAEGKKMESLVAGLARIRAAHPALRSRNVYPTLADYDRQGSGWLARPNPQGYGLDQASGILIFHRYGAAPGDRLAIVVLNFSDRDWTGRVPFTKDGRWRRLQLFDGDGVAGEDLDVASGGAQVTVGSNFGHVFVST